MFPKYIYWLVWGVVALVCSVVPYGVLAQSSDFYYDQTQNTPSSTTQVGEIVHDDIVDAPQGFLQQLLDVLGLSQYASGTDPSTGDTLWATNLLRRIINIAIGLSALLALIVLIYGFGSILFLSDEEGVDRARKYIKGAAIAILLLGVSRLIVSGIFYVYGVIADQF